VDVSVDEHDLLQRHRRVEGEDRLVVVIVVDDLIVIVIFFANFVIIVVVTVVFVVDDDDVIKDLRCFVSMPAIEFPTF
jgi:hypothetical protein